VVGGVAELPGEDPEATAERVRDDAHARRGAVERGEAVGRGGLDDLAPAGPRADGGGTGRGIDADAVHPPCTDQDPALVRARQPVPGGLYPDGQAVFGRVGHGGDDVVGAHGADDEGGPRREAGLEPGEFLVVPGVTGPEHESLCGEVHEMPPLGRTCATHWPRVPA
jgi:hypothetical protein